MPPRGRVRRAKRAPAPSFTSIVNAILARTAEMLRSDDPLAVEMAASIVDGLAYHPDLGPGDSREAVGRLLVKHLRQRATPEAVNLLHGLSVATVTDPVREAARRELQELRFAHPSWASQIGQPRFTGAWRLSEPHGDYHAYLVAFQYPGRSLHAIFVLVDWNMGGLLKNAALTDDVEGTLSRWRADFGRGSAEPADAQDVADVLAHAVWLYDHMLPDEDIQEKVRSYRGLIGARLRLLPPAGEGSTIEVPEAERAALLGEFLSAPEGSPFRERALVVERLIDFASDHGDPSPLRWSPARVELALTYWLPRKAILDQKDLQAAPDVLRAFVRFAGRRRDLPEQLIRETERAVDEFEAEFFRAMGDPNRFGPAKAVVLAMRAEGVDHEDQAAVDAQLEDFNARPREERERLIPWPRD